MLRISRRWCLVWYLAFFTPRDWRLSQVLPQHFSSVTACARAPGCFDMEQKVQPVSRTLLNPESPCTQGCFRSQPDDMMRNYLGGTALLTWQKHHLCYIAAVSLPQFSRCDKYVCCSRHNCSLQIHCMCVAGSAHWGQIFKIPVNSCDAYRLFSEDQG